jgi:hypothetical protein
MPLLKKLRISLDNDEDSGLRPMETAGEDWCGALDVLELVIEEGDGGVPPGGFPMLGILLNAACLTHDRSRLLISGSLAHRPYILHFGPERCTSMLHWVRR